MSEQTEMAYCPNCDGSGESTVLSDGGPDAYDVPICCPHCNGKGTLEDAYKGVLELYNRERTKYSLALPIVVAFQRGELVRTKP